MNKLNQNQSVPTEVAMATVKELLNTNLAQDPMDFKDSMQEMFELLMMSEGANTKNTRENAYLVMNAFREMAYLVHDLQEKLETNV